MGRNRIATKKFATQLQLSERDESAGIAGEGTISETSRKGTGPRPIENEACGREQVRRVVGILRATGHVELMQGCGTYDE